MINTLLYDLQVVWRLSIE